LSLRGIHNHDMIDMRSPCCRLLCDVWPQGF
jgi:hypothetical protein